MSGIIGCISFNGEDVSSYLIQGMYSLQHRGQDNIGMGYKLNDHFHVEHYQGVISSHEFPAITSSSCLGYINYAFSKGKKSQPLQPICDETHMSVYDGMDMNQDPSACASITIEADKMTCMRDLFGIKPLVLGRIGTVWIVCSESCVLDALGGSVIRDIRPGEIITITDKGLESHRTSYEKPHLCLFELVYIARQDSCIDGISVYGSRIKMGEQLFKEAPIEADIVVGSPDSGLIAALGYAQASNIPYQKALVKNRYIARTFIDNGSEKRKQNIKLKLSVVKELVMDKRVVLVDDSIVRGATMRRVIELLKQAGAREVHVRVAAPPVLYPDNLSIDIPRNEDLVCYDKTIEEVRVEMGCDSLYFLSLEGLKSACGNQDFYTEYFDGKSPIKKEVNDESNI